jgi:uncharacterized protein DUF5665
MEENTKKAEQKTIEPQSGTDPATGSSSPVNERNSSEVKATRNDISKNNKKLKLLEASIVRLNNIMERSHWVSVAETTEMVKRPWRATYINFLIGLSRGVGFAVGLIVLGTIVVYLLLKLLQNLGDVPLIGEYIAEIVKYVQNSLDNH